MTRDEVSYRALGSDSWSRIPTATVSLVEKRQRRGVGRGALVGAAPGLLIAVAGIASVASCDGETPYCGFGGALAMGAGVALAGVGVVIGAAVGGTYGPEYQTVYLGPVDRYFEEDDISTPLDQ